MVQKHILYIGRSGQTGRADTLSAGDIQYTVLSGPGPEVQYASAENRSGPTTELMAQYAKKYNMVTMFRTMKRSRLVLHNTAAVIDADEPTW